MLFYEPSQPRIPKMQDSCVLDVCYRESLRDLANEDIQDRRQYLEAGVDHEF